MLSLYIHIPFCEVKCGYCDFFSLPRGHEDFDLQKEYVSALIQEIEARSPQFSGRPPVSIFFGGGTPSLLHPRFIEKILETLGKYFSWDASLEITLETNPKTVSRDKLKDFYSLGINRLSIGVQSFQEKFLKGLGRIHSGDEARKTIEDAARAGFKNRSFDLIYALPEQSFEEWQKDLKEAVSLGLSHLSAYHLTIEPGTPFALQHRQGLLRLPTEDDGLRMFEWTREYLSQHHLDPYEISNFAQEGFESIHNQNYWHYGDYLGFGTGAASFLREPETTRKNGELFGIRHMNSKNLKKYLEGDFREMSENISLETAMGEFCFLGLRTKKGILGDIFLKNFSRSLDQIYSREIEKNIQRGWLEASDQGFRLTSSGILFADDVASSFLFF